MRRCWLYALLLIAGGAAGCGTTKWSDSPRTATEQLLVSDAVDRAISAIDFSALNDNSVYLDTRFIETTLDHNYVVSTLRQHMLASGCIIMDKPDEADYVVEVRTGSLGTNRNDVLVGMPATQLPSMGLMPTAAAIPEIALSKRTSQQAVCKIAVFAYDRMSGRPVWQSGNRKVASTAKDTWLFGTGPFQRGHIYDGTSFAGEKLKVPLLSKRKSQAPPTTSVGTERRFDRSTENRLDDSGRVENAGYSTPLPGVSAPRADQLPGGAPSTAEKPSPNAGASAAPPRRAAYTPPVTNPAKSTPPASSGPQGELASQPLAPVVNPAATTAGAVQTFNLARDWLEQK